MTRDQIEFWVRDGESETLECKRTTGERRDGMQTPGTPESGVREDLQMLKKLQLAVITGRGAGAKWRLTNPGGV